MHYFSDLFDKVLCMFRTGPLSIIRSISSLYIQHDKYMLCIQWWDTPDDGQWACPKHAEYFIKEIWEIVHLVGFYYKNLNYLYEKQVLYL